MSLLKTNAIQTTSGKPILNSTGSVLQVVQTAKTNVFSTSSTSFVDVTGLSASITPSSATSNVLIMVNGVAGMSGGVSGYLRLLRETIVIFAGDTTSGYTSVSSASFYGGSGDGNNNEMFSMCYLDSPSTTSSITYKVQAIAPQGGNLIVNGLGSDASGSVFSARAASSVTLFEISS
jgi:hypothetical protein